MDRKPQLKSPTDFAHPDEWRQYVRQTVSPDEVGYTLAFGRTIMFARFYEARNQPFPDRFSSEMAAIGQLHDPERTEALEALNDRIFADMTQFLLAAARPEVSERVEIATPVSPRELIDELAAYLTKENPYYALWIRYTSPVSEPNSELAWEEFVAQELGDGTNEEIEFALLVGQLGKLLTYFRRPKPCFTSPFLRSGFGSCTICLERSAMRMRAPLCRNWLRQRGHARAHNQLRNELVGHALTQPRRSILLPPLRRVVQLGGTQVRPQVATVLGVSRSDPVQPEQRFSAGASAAVHGEDISVQRSKPFGRAHAPSICPPVR